MKKALNGMRGVHLVAAEVCKHGFAPVVTMRNTPFADVLAQPLTFEGAPVAISVKYSARGSFFLLGKELPRNDKAFFILVQEPRYWIVPSRELADSPEAKPSKSGAPAGYLGVYKGKWGFEVYTRYLARFEGAWARLIEGSKS